MKAKKSSSTTELEELLGKTREEKDRADARIANLQESLSHSQNEVTKLKDKLYCLEEELKVSSNT